MSENAQKTLASVVPVESKPRLVTPFMKGIAAGAVATGSLSVAFASALEVNLLPLTIPLTSLGVFELSLALAFYRNLSDKPSEKTEEEINEDDYNTYRAMLGSFAVNGLIMVLSLGAATFIEANSSDENIDGQEKFNIAQKEQSAQLDIIEVEDIQLKTNFDNDNTPVITIPAAMKMA